MKKEIFGYFFAFFMLVIAPLLFGISYGVWIGLLSFLCIYSFGFWCAYLMPKDKKEDK